MNSRIDKGRAAGLRRTHGREFHRDLNEALAKVVKSRKFDVMPALRATGGVAGLYRRGPRPNRPAGADVVLVDRSQEDGHIGLSVISLDKNGDPLPHMAGRMMLRISRHAVESLYQRLRTPDKDQVQQELQPLARWLFEKREELTVAPGLLLTANGVFLAVPGEPYLSSQTDALNYWVATTWIADTALEDHTSGKLRVATLVRNARKAGANVAFIAHQ